MGVERVECAEPAMGSWFALVLIGPRRAALEAAAGAAFDEVHRLDRLLSNYSPRSEWSAVNREAATRPVGVSQEVFDLLSLCLDTWRESDGAFDVTVGPLIKLWGFYNGEATLPSADAVGATLARVGAGFVELDAERRTVRFLRPGVELDPGAIGKGYAVDRMVAVLRAHGVDAALVSAAGSSIFGLGTPPDEPGWRVSIGLGRGASTSAADVRLEDLSVSTSGSREKCFRAGGRTYSHLLDPRTGFPAQGASSVSVLAERAVDSEAWSTPYFVNGRAWTAAHRRPGHRVFFCDDAPQVTCGWIE